MASICITSIHIISFCIQIENKKRKTEIFCCCYKIFITVFTNSPKIKGREKEGIPPKKVYSSKATLAEINSIHSFIKRAITIFFLLMYHRTHTYFLLSKNEWFINTAHTFTIYRAPIKAGIVCS